MELHVPNTSIKIFQFCNVEKILITGGAGTIGQELIDLQETLDSGVITQEEYDELRKKIMERYDAPVDSTDTN